MSRTFVLSETFTAQPAPPIACILESPAIALRRPRSAEHSDAPTPYHQLKRTMLEISHVSPNKSPGACGMSVQLATRMRSDEGCVEEEIVIARNDKLVRM